MIIPDIIIEDGLSIVQQRGCGQYTMRLYEILKSIDGINVELKRKPFLENIKNSAIRRLLYILWLNTFFLLSLLFKNKPKVCIFSSVVTPMIKIPNTKYISILHDIRSVLYPELSTKIQNLHSDFANWTAVKFSDKLVTVSETSKNDIIKNYKINPDKITVIYNTSSVAEIQINMEDDFLSRYKLEMGKYLLFVGGLDKNKNIQLIIDSFNLISEKYPDLKLVIVGNKGNSDIKIGKNTILTGFISNEEIKCLYKNAAAYLFPSIYEGFGIPILDAQIIGCPVICSDIPVFREIGRDSVIYSILDKDIFSQKIDNLLTNAQEKDSLIRLGYENVKRFSKEVIKEQLLQCIKE